MKCIGADAIYKNYVADHDLERLDVFECMGKKYGSKIRCVLYPGCFVHVTPSFVFPHVAYADKDPFVRTFFGMAEAVQELIASRKKYRRRTHVEFHFCDYQDDLPLREGSFDLLIALYAPRITLTCKKYLKKGGLLLTDNHYDDGARAHADPEYSLIGVVKEKSGGYAVEDTGLERYFVRKNLMRGNREYTYVHQAPYYIFRRIPGRSQAREPSRKKGSLT